MNMLATIDIERLEELPAASMLRLTEMSKRARKSAAAFGATIQAIPGLFLKMEEMDIEPGFRLDDEYITLSFAGDGAKLGRVWGELRRHGYTTTSRPEKGKNEFYSFWEREGLSKIFLHFTSSVCRRVKVGEKTVTVDVFETQCGDLMPEIEEIQPAPELTVIDGGADELPF